MKIKAGDVFQTNEGCRVMVIEYRGWKEIEIAQIDAHQHRDIVRAGNLRNGNVKNPFHPSVHDVGYLGIGSYRASIGGKGTPAYESWVSMLKRCYDANSLLQNPTYNGCSVHPNWHSFQSFAEWYGKEPNSGKLGFDLDKDLRQGGNKVYSPDTCSFVPKQINTLLGDNGAARGSLPQGVRADGKMFVARLNINGKQLHLGTYATPELAFEVYKNAKADNVRSMAEEWKSYLHHDVYSYLMTWEI